MSTILDALRKVEENHRTRSADARARLLSSPTRPSSHAFRQRRTPWLIGAALALTGFTAGAGLMLWGPRSPAPEESQRASATGAEATPDKEVSPPESLAQATPVPFEPASTDPSAQPVPQAPVGMSSDPAPTPTVPPPTAPTAISPGVHPAPAAPVNKHLTPMERRAARREALSATRQAAPRGAPPPPSRALAAATGAAQPQPPPLPQPREDAQPAAPPPHTAAPGTKSSAPATAAVPPNTSLSFLQWSPEPDRRLAFIKVDGGPLTLAHEGDTVAGYTVVEIRRDAVELNGKGHSFTLQVGP
ncbi:MAG TPA: hypothetical protein VKJ47_01630 [Candidatus Binatia bacterium]|nr:hypothetical protein [Candidatus Binatia bacterium]